MALPRYEIDVTSQFNKCEGCSVKDVPLFFSPKTEPPQEVIGQDNKAVIVAVPRVVCEKCHAKESKEHGHAKSKK
jgi:hypothetical protein